jgi:hypothetical protein
MFKFSGRQSFSTLKEVLPNDASRYTQDLILDLLVYDPARRLDVKGSLRHGYFRREGPNPCTPGQLRLKLSHQPTRLTESKTGAWRRKIEEEGDRYKRLKLEEDWRFDLN